MIEDLRTSGPSLKLPIAGNPETTHDPLVAATGAGARQSIGTTVFGGMVLASFVGVLFVPPLFAIFERFAEWIVRRVRRRAPSPERRAS